MKAFMIYTLAAETRKVRTNYPAHRARLEEFKSRGLAFMAGSFSEPTKGALGIFASREAAEEFVNGDPLVLNGAVAEWTITDWQEVLS